MAAFLLSMQAFFFQFLVLSASNVSAQSTTTADTDFSCSTNSTQMCDTFVTYRAWSPDYLDLGRVSDLFGTSRLNIAKASQLVSENAQLVPKQLLLIPIKCSCNGSYFFSNVSYQIKRGDNFYSVSTHAFQNLTKYQYAEDMNPTVNPVNLTIGAELVFPLLCKCPAQSDLQKGFQYLITYVWQPGDEVLPMSAMFNTSPIAIDAENNHRNFSAAACLPVLIPVQKPLVLQTFPPPPSTRKSKHKRTLIVVLTISVAVLLILLASLSRIHILLKRRKAMGRNSSSVETSDLLRTRRASFESKTNQDKILPGVSGYLGKLIVYEMEVIMEATLELSEQYRIGGSVYKAKIHDQIFAVKKTKDATEELNILQKVSHANLLKLMGISADNQRTFFLVFEYAENGSLDQWLFHKSSPSSGSISVLNWSQRVNIALDVANGLQYMHEHTQPSIVHRDIRASNILLDSKFKAKIGNFSLATPATSPTVLKVDVFAFGVLLLELISGRKSMETKNNGEIVMLWKEIKGILEVEEKKEERLRRWIDPHLETFYPIDGALSLASLARACTSDKSFERPKMAEVVFHLCVLSQSSSGIHERSWTFGEADEAIQFVTPIIAR
ncbi:unnamed protein product [Coffea canephora]|uniref:non-specific serine/threonine protein kinase n=1 Tax=Coffea canephora TaxID=49390 RepID=A0A068U478_COFCA|nr:unnamed protein product [Coffea canephora]